MRDLLQSIMNDQQELPSRSMPEFPPKFKAMQEHPTSPGKRRHGASSGDRKRIRTTSSDESDGNGSSDESGRSSLTPKGRGDHFAEFCISLDKMVKKGPKGKVEILKVLWSLYQSHTGRKD